jgi:uncharacterized protein YggU (UPF0235/DUF167 family)
MQKSYAGVTSTLDAPRTISPDGRSLRVVVAVRPGSRVEHVGGAHGGALVVRVRARAIDQAATRATLAVLADAFGVRASAVRLERGATSRRKVVIIEGDATELARRCDRLLNDAR